MSQNQNSQTVEDGGKASVAGESMFIKYEKPELKGKDDKMAGIFSRDVHFHSETPNEYGEGSEQDQAGTIVPVSDREGGIKQKTNKYGRVVVGDRIGKDSAEPLDVSGLEAIELKEAAVEDKPAGTPSVSDGVPGTSSVPVPQHTTIDKSATQQVIFEGTFGSFKGSYKAVLKQNGMLIAIYDLAESVYTPPVSEEPFRIKTADIDCQVTHMGICFEIELFNCGFQVFVIKG